MDEQVRELHQRGPVFLIPILLSHLPEQLLQMMPPICVLPSVFSAREQILKALGSLNRHGFTSR